MSLERFIARGQLQRWYRLGSSGSALARLYCSSLCGVPSGVGRLI